MPAIPPELILLPPRAPLSIYSFGCWARQTIVALSVVSALRPVTTVPFAVDELRTGAAPLPPADAWGRAFEPARPRPAPLRAAAGRRAPAARAADRRALDRRRGRSADGSWGGIQPPWVWSMIGLHALGYDVDHPVLGARPRRARQLHDRGRRRAADRGLPVAGLGHRAGADRAARRRPRRPSTRRSRAARAGSPASEVRVRGDWAVRRPDIAAGRLPVRVRERQLPRRRRHRRRRARAAPRGGGRRVEQAGRRPRPRVGARHAEQGRRLGRLRRRQHEHARALKLPFCDFGAVTDPPSADVTAHVLELLGHEGLADGAGDARRGVDYLLREQERDGSWFGRWGANHLYGTGAAVPALAACGLAGHRARSRRRLVARRACRTPDGGFGEDLRSYRDAAWRGRGDVDRLADRLGAARLRRRRRVGGPAGRARRPLAASRRSGRAAAGTSPTTPAPASRATSISTTTCTGTCSR